jgi:DNA-binding XRE family transcriptional regulator
MNMEEIIGAYSGKNLQGRRRSLLLTQDELAKKLSVTKQTIADWEVGRTMPSLRNVRKLKEFFEIQKN